MKPSAIRHDVPLGPWCTLGVGGPASYFVEASEEAELVAALKWADSQGIVAYILGGGSNLVVADDGVDGLVIRMATRGHERRRTETGIEWTAAAGEVWDDFVRDAVGNRLAGVECLSGIPGLVGATPIQNVGAYGQEVSDTITRVRVIDRHDFSTKALHAADMAFGYRDSAFKSKEPGRYVILDVSYVLRPDGAPTVRYADLQNSLERAGRIPASLEDVREAVLEIRRSKSMVIVDGDPNRRSCGSFFLNPVVTKERLEAVCSLSSSTPPHFPQVSGAFKLSAAWLIEQAGFRRGERRGKVGLSTRHTLAIVCDEGATASQIIDFAQEIRARVAARFGVELSVEPNYWGLARL